MLKVIIMVVGVWGVPGKEGSQKNGIFPPLSPQHEMYLEKQQLEIPVLISTPWSPFDSQVRVATIQRQFGGEREGRLWGGVSVTGVMPVTRVN